MKGELLDFKDHKVFQVHQDHKENVEIQDLTALKVNPDPQENRVWRDHPEKQVGMVKMESLDHQVHQDPLDQ